MKNITVDAGRPPNSLGHLCDFVWTMAAKNVFLWVEYSFWFWDNNIELRRGLSLCL